MTAFENESDTLEDGNHKGQESWAEKLFSVAKHGRNSTSIGQEDACEAFLTNARDEFSSWVALMQLLSFHDLLSSVIGNVWILISIT